MLDICPINFELIIAGKITPENINKINQKNRNFINQTIKNFQENYSDNCRVFIRPSGTEPVMRVLVEAKNHNKVDSLSKEITNKLFLAIDKITNQL